MLKKKDILLLVGFGILGITVISGTAMVFLNNHNKTEVSNSVEKMSSSEVESTDQSDNKQKEEKVTLSSEETKEDALTEESSEYGEQEISPEAREHFASEEWLAAVEKAIEEAEKGPYGKLEEAAAGDGALNENHSGTFKDDSYVTSDTETLEIKDMVYANQEASVFYRKEETSKITPNEDNNIIIMSEKDAIDSGYKHFSE